ncbi:MAG: dockerin type I repeat-containing protein, partial [Candidatus Zixiibacteriota bacterium]
GAMNFYLEENSPRIASLTPESGAVPQLVAITFDSVYCGMGMSYTDTIWAYSLEAPNSPQMLILDYHCYADPAKIIVSKDTVNASIYECSQGMNPPPAPFFTVYNDGSESFTFDLSWNSDWLMPSDTSALAPKIITLFFDYKNMLPGVYYDTIVVSAYNAVNTPESLTLTLTIKETAVAPLIYLNRNNLSFYAQENRVGRQFFVSLNNVNPGCMDWYIQEDMPWMDFGIDTKDGEEEEAYPWNIRLMPNGYGMTYGFYKDTALIVADSASNSPYPLILDISIWKFYGDCNWNGSINILDVNYLLRYLYRGGPEPLPMRLIGDCNCDLQVNLLDVTILIDYIYHGSQPICGNPY